MLINCNKIKINRTVGFGFETRCVLKIAFVYLKYGIAT